MKKVLLGLIVFFLLFSCSGPVNHEFGSGEESLDNVSRAVSHKSDVINYYNNWKKLYMKSWGTDCYYVDQSYEILQGWIIAGDSDSDSAAKKAENKKNKRILSLYI